MTRFRMPIWISENDPFWKTVRDLADKSLLTRTVREGVRLIQDLRAGKVDVLLELFPTVRDSLMANSLTTLEGELASFREFLIARERVQEGAAPKRIASAERLPKHDDLSSLLEVKEGKDITPDEGRPSSAQNLIDSMKRMQAVKSPVKARAVRQYGTVLDAKNGA